MAACSPQHYYHIAVARVDDIGCSPIKLYGLACVSIPVMQRCKVDRSAHVLKHVPAKDTAPDKVQKGVNLSIWNAKPIRVAWKRYIYTVDTDDMLSMVSKVPRRTCAFLLLRQFAEEVSPGLFAHTFSLHGMCGGVCY